MSNGVIQPIRTNLGFQPPATPAAPAPATGGAGRSPTGTALDAAARIGAGFFNSDKKEDLEEKKRRRKERQAKNAITAAIREEVSILTTPGEDVVIPEGAPPWTAEDASKTLAPRGQKAIDKLIKQFPDQAHIIQETGTTLLKKSSEFLDAREEVQEEYYLRIMDEEQDTGNMLALEQIIEGVGDSAGDPDTSKLSVASYFGQRHVILETAKERGIDETEQFMDYIEGSDRLFVARYVDGLRSAGRREEANELLGAILTGNAKMDGIDVPFLGGMTVEERQDFLKGKPGVSGFTGVEGLIDIIQNARLGQIAEDKAMKAQESADAIIDLDVAAELGIPLEEVAPSVADLEAREVWTPEFAREQLEGYDAKSARLQIRAQNRAALVSENWSVGDAEVALDLNDGDLHKAREFLQDRSTDKLLLQTQSSNQNKVIADIDAGILKDEDEIRRRSDNVGLAEANIRRRRMKRQEESAFNSAEWYRTPVDKLSDPKELGIPERATRSVVVRELLSDILRDAPLQARIIQEQVRRGDIEDFQMEGEMDSWINTRVGAILGEAGEFGTEFDDNSAEDFRTAFTIIFRNDPRTQKVITNTAKRYGVAPNLGEITVANFETAFGSIKGRLQNDIDAAANDPSVHLALSNELADINAAERAMSREFEALNNAAISLKKVLLQPKQGGN